MKFLTHFIAALLGFAAAKLLDLFLEARDL